jgi:hypothetical protein
MLWFGKKKHKQVKNFTPIRVKNALTKRTIAIRLSVVLILGALAAYTFIWPHTTEAGWTDPAWLYRKKIVINNAQVAGSSDFTNFPVMIQIRDPDLKRGALANGNDIRFTSANGRTQIDHEIEEYNSLTGDLVAWVEVPVLGGATDTTIYMYYGNKAASNQANPTGVWDSNYQAVWHNKETSGNRTDSTSNAYTLTDNGGVSNYEKIANASNYVSASSQRLSIADASAPNLDITGSITIESWVYLTSTAATQMLVSKDGSAGQQGYLLRYNLNGRFNFILSDDGTAQTAVNGGTTVTTGAWYHVVGVYDGTDMKIYVNGASDATPVSYSSGIFDNNNATLLGARATLSQPLDGALDESRISNTARSADWIATEYNNMSSPTTFYTINGQERGPVILNWKFDEMQGTAANDSSGNGNTGVISGPTWVDSSMCVSGGCLKFDTGNVSRSYSVDTELDPGTTSFSTSIWFKHNTTAPSGDPQAIISRYNNTGYRVYMTTTGTMCFAIDDDSTWDPDDSACSTTTYLDNKWHYLHAVKTDTTSIALYIDGERVAIDSSISATASLSGSSTATYLGSDSSSGQFVQRISANNRDGLEWNGTWDGNSIYAGNWDSNDEYPAFHFSGVTVPQGATITSATMLIRAGSVGNDPSLVDLRIRAQDADTASVPSGSNFPSAFSFTTAQTNYHPGAWVASTDYTTSNFASVIQEVVDRGGWASGNNMNIVMSPDTGQSPQNDIEIVDYNSSAANAAQITINYSVGSGGGFNTWVGFVDDFKIYDNAPTDAQIKAYYGSRGSVNGISTSIGGNKNSEFTNSRISDYLIGYWKMDESSANSCTGGSNDSCDSSGMGFDGAWNGNTTLSTTARFNRSTTYDGTGDYTQVSDNASLRPENGPYTISFWANPANSNQYSPLISKQQGSGDFEQYSIAICGALDCQTNGQNLALFFRQSETVERRFLSTADVADGNWHMYTMVIDNESQTIRAYVDGVQLTAGTTVTDGVWPTVNNTDALRFGGDSIGTAGYTGQLDEVRMYRKALTPENVKQLYEKSAGPIGYWNMNERSGTTIADSSGNGFSGDLQNSARFGSGKFGSALLLNGTSQYVRLSSQSGLNITAGTVMAWVYPTSTPASDQQIVMANRDTSRIYLYRLATNGNLGIRLGTSSAVNTGINLATNTWNHVALTYNNGTYYAYVNGRQVATGAYSGISSLNGFSIIGAYDDLAGDVNSWFPGKIDEVKMYAYPRTEKEVTEDMNAGQPPPGSPVGSALAYWKFDEGRGTTANNAGNQGSALNGTLTNMAAVVTTDSGWTNSGKFNKAIKLDGSNDYVLVGNQTAIQTFNTLTISGWIKADTFATGDLNVIYYKDTSGFYFGVNDNKLRFRSSDLTSDLTETTTNLSTGVWTHVAATYDGATVKLYVNGREEVSEAATGTISENTINATIGAFGTSSNFFDGTIDELKLYDSALTAQQIQLDYNQSKGVIFGAISTESDGKTPSFNQDREYCIPGDTATCLPPVAEYKLDERTGTTANDTSGKNNNGTLTNSPTWSIGKVGSGVRFNGTNQYIALPNNNAALQNTNSVSVEAWIYPTATISSTQYIIGYTINGNTTTERMSMRVASTNALRCEIFMPDGSTAVNSNVSNIITPNAWNHVACVFNYSNARMTLMVNGQTVNYPGKTYTQGTTSNTTSDRSAIGARPDGGGSYFAGVIDDVRVFGYERSVDQIMWDYNKGKPRFHMKMDECTGTTINDSSRNGYTGTLNIGGGGTQTAAGTCYTSGAWFNGVTGKFNSAISLDGTDDNITTAAQAIIALDSASTSNGSWGGWFYPTGSAASKTLIHRNNEMQLFTDSSSRPTCKAEASSTTAVGTEALPLNTWTNVFCTYDGTNLKLFVNGREITAVTLTPGQFDSTSLVTYIGSTATSTQWFSGMIDDVRIYNTLLTTTQLNNIMNEGAAVRFGP